METKTILLVEDDDVVRDMIRGALDREYHVLEASTYSQAIPQIRKPLDLALVDYNLPDSDGFDVLRSIREVKPDLPVIFMTAYSTDNLAIKAFRSGVTDFIKKPLSFAYLRSKLSELLRGTENREDSETAESGDVFVMDCIAAFIEQNYNQNLSRDELAKRAHMNRYRFSRAFNERFGKSVKAYINEVRIEKAAEFLKQNTELGVADIATLVGFKDPAYFDKLFKENYGMPPGKYREDQGKASRLDIA
jgi:two-component system sensor histidine kinase YesM